MYIDLSIVALSLGCLIVLTLGVGVAIATLGVGVMLATLGVGILSICRLSALVARLFALGSWLLARGLGLSSAFGAQLLALGFRHSALCSQYLALGSRLLAD